MNNERTESATVAREAIAAKVRGAVAEHQKTQREIGEILGLPQSVIQLRLKGERAFKAEELAKLADALGVPVERFFPVAATEAGVA